MEIFPEILSKCPINNAVQIASAAAIAAGVIYYFWKRGRCEACWRMNPGIDKNSPKVVNTIDIEDIGEQAVFCRCWRSAKFPYCDGSHNKFNQESGENVGPLIVKKKK